MMVAGALQPDFFGECSAPPLSISPADAGGGVVERRGGMLRGGPLSSGLESSRSPPAEAGGGAARGREGIACGPGRSSPSSVSTGGGDALAFEDRTEARPI